MEGEVEFFRCKLTRHAEDAVVSDEAFELATQGMTLDPIHCSYNVSEVTVEAEVESTYSCSHRMRLRALPRDQCPRTPCSP